MKIKCSTCGKEYTDLPDAYECCIKEEMEGGIAYLISNVALTLDKPIQHINVDWIDNVTTTQH